MASGSNNLTSYKAKQIIGSSIAASPAGALLFTGENYDGDTWIYHYGYGGTTNPWGIRHDTQASEIIVKGNGTDSFWIKMNTGDTYVLGKMGIGYDPNTTGNSYKLYVNGSSYINGSLNTGSVLTVRAQNDVHEGGEIVLNPATDSFSTVHIDAYDSMFRLHDGTNERFKVNISSGNTTINGNLGVGADYAVLGGSYKLYVNGATRIDSTLHILPNSGNYTEGIRIHSYGSWSDISLCGDDNTGDTGTSANSWFIGNNNGNFYITRYGSTSSGADAQRSEFSSVSNQWRLRSYVQAHKAGIYRSGLHIYGPTYGNTAADMASGTAGLFSWNDGGPQITFDTSATPGGSQAGALIYTDHDTAATGASWHFVSNQSDWNVTSKRFHARSSISVGTNLPVTTQALNVSGLAAITNNSNTVTIGSQNTTATHIYSSANIPFAFNNTVLTTTGNLGSTSYPWGNLYIGKADGAGIYYVTNNYTKEVIRFLNHSADQYGVGLKICTGGLIIIGAGESGDTVQTNLTPASSAETLYLAADSNILFYPNNDSYDAAAKIEMTAGRIWAGVNGNTTRENQIGVQSGAGQMYMWAHASTTGDRGIWVTAHGSGAAHAIFSVNTNNQTAFADYYNNTLTRLAYSQSGLAASAITWLTCWNGYELRAISKAEMANAVDGSHKWVRLGGDTMTGTLTIHNSGTAISWPAPSNITCTATANSQEWSFDMNPGSYTGTYWHVWSSKKGASCLQCFADDRHSWAYQLYGAVWNDYAEFRKAEEVEYGRVVVENEDKQMKLCNERLAPAAKVTSDTFGISIGKSKEYNMPIAVSGRVLVFPYQDRDKYKLGDAVCSAPGGTVDIMTRKEIKEYPERILGTVSEIPDYDIWYGGGENENDGGRDPVPVKGRIWVYVK